MPSTIESSWRGVLLLALCVSVAASARPARLCPDPGFADGGVFIAHLRDGDSVDFTAQGLAVQADGKVLVGGTGGTGRRVFAVLRLLADGSRDPGFGDAGVAWLDLGGGEQGLQSLAVLPSGKVRVAGSQLGPTQADGGALLSSCVGQLTSTGAPDLAFGIAGVSRPQFGSGYQLINAQQVLPGGAGRLAGQCETGLGVPGINVCVFGIHDDGGLDRSFSDAGLVELDFSGGDEFGGFLSLDSLGRLTVAGTAFMGMNGTGFDFGLARLLPDGRHDPTFGRPTLPGRVTTDFFGDDDECHAVLTQGDGRIVCAGVAASDAGTRFVLARYQGSGDLDPSFADGGRLAPLAASGEQEARALTLLPDGTLVVGGRDRSPTGGLDFVMVFLDPFGELNPDYGDGGVLRVDVGSGRDDAVHSLAVDAEGRLLVYGDTATSTGNDVAVLRFGPCGTVDGGPPDAGTSQPAAAQVLRVGCGCSAPFADASGLLLVALALAVLGRGKLLSQAARLAGKVT